MRILPAAALLAALLGVTSGVSVAGPPKPTLTAPSISCADETQTTITLAITGTGEYGAPAGFTVQWTTCAALAANRGRWPSDPCDASLSGNASGFAFSLSPDETVTVTIGDLGSDPRPGISWSCGDDPLACGTCYVFRVFAHGNDDYAKSAFSADHQCSTAACGDTGCGTAFAKGPEDRTWVFYEGAGDPDHLPALSTGNGRWGWAIDVPSTDGTTTADLWAGAGGNDTSKGTLVGTVTITVKGDTVTVVYDMDAGYSLDEVHVYASDTKPEASHGPTGDVDSPGHYGYTDEDPDADGTTATFTLTDGDGDGDGFWIIAHAVVCGLPTD